MGTELILCIHSSFDVHLGCFDLLTLVICAAGFPDGSDGKDLPAMQETWIQSLGREDTLKKGIATHTSILAWRIPWTDEPGRL